jgi:hypothetical protein
MPWAWYSAEEPHPVTAAEVDKYLRDVMSADDEDLPADLVAGVADWARAELGAKRDPGDVLNDVFTRLRQIHFDQPRKCACGTVLAPRGWRGSLTLSCTSCGTVWRVRATDTAASIRRVGS